MVAYTDSIGFDKGSAAPDYRGSHRTYVAEVLMDFAAITAARVAAGATAFTDTDSIQAIPIPAQTVVHAVGLEVLVAEGGTATADVGSTDTDGYLDGVDINAAAGTSYATSDGATGYAVGFYYGSEDTIDLLMVNALDTAVIRIWAICTNVDGSVEYQT